MTIVSLGMFIAIQAVSPVGEVETVKWAKNVGYVLAEGGELTFTVKGPTSLVVDFFGAPALQRKTVNLELLRDGRFSSKNSLSMGRGRGPKGHPAMAKLGLEVPEGEHTYVLKGDAALVVASNEVKRIPPRIAKAGKETEIESPEQAAQAQSTDDTAVPKDAGMEAIMASTAQATQKIANEVSGSSADNDSPKMGARTQLTQAMRVAVYDLEVEDVAPNIGRVVTDSLLAEVRKLQGVSAIGMDEIRDMLSFEADKQLLGCESDESCLAEIAGALGVDNLVTGKLAMVDEGSAVMLIRRIDQTRAKVAGVVNRRLKAGSGQEFLAAVGPAIEELFPERPLREGAERGVPKEVALRLDPPPLKRWHTLSVVGAALATAAAGGVFGIMTMGAQQEWNTTVNQEGVIDGATLVGIGNRLQNNAKTANILFISTGAVALVAGVMALFTDWHGYGEVK